MNFELFDPTMPSDPSEKEPIRYAPRPDHLDGLKVGLVDNTKFNSRTLLTKISERLKAEFNMETVRIVTKQSAGHPISQEAIDALKTEADIAIAGIGD